MYYYYLQAKQTTEVIGEVGLGFQGVNNLREYQDCIMASIKSLQDKISQLTKVVEEYSISFKKEPQNFSIKLTIDNIKSQIEELQEQLYHENLTKIFS